MEWHSRPVTTLAAVVGLIVLVATYATTWGVTENRIDTLEKTRAEEQRLITQQIQANSDQEARIRVLENQISAVIANQVRAEAKIDTLLERHDGARH
jgi:Tfp pilus assembly protein PilO